MVAGVKEFSSLKGLHLGTIYLWPDGNNLYSLNKNRLSFFNGSGSVKEGEFKQIFPRSFATQFHHSFQPVLVFQREWPKPADKREN